MEIFRIWSQTKWWDLCACAFVCSKFGWHCFNLLLEFTKTRVREWDWLWASDKREITAKGSLRICSVWWYEMKMKMCSFETSQYYLAFYSFCSCMMIPFATIPWWFASEIEFNDLLGKALWAYEVEYWQQYSVLELCSMLNYWLLCYTL